MQTLPEDVIAFNEKQIEELHFQIIHLKSTIHSVHLRLGYLIGVVKRGHGQETIIHNIETLRRVLAEDKD